MMLLAREINTKLPEAVGKSADATTRVGCATCHRGVPIPKQIADIVTDAGRERRRDRRPGEVQRDCGRSSTAARATTSAKAA